MSLFGFKTKRALGESHNGRLGITGREMPPIKIMAPANVRYYKFHFLEDGFPAQKRNDGTIYEHPLYPIYIAEEYFRQNTRHPDPALVEAAKLVIDAALKRVQPLGDALVFWYGANAGVKRAAHRHYSALTQAYYVATLARLNDLLGQGSDYGKLSQRFAESLAIPTSLGGVMQVRLQGKGIEELPLAMPELVLNGWVSALSKLTPWPALLRQAGLATFLDENLDLLEYLLPRYDVPKLKNSRYSLSGYVYLRLVASGRARIMLRDASCSWSPSEKFPVGIGSDYRWANFLLGDDVVAQPDGTFESRGNSVRANLVLSQLAQENAFEFVASTSKPAEIRVEMTVGEYNPLSTIPASTKWIRLETVAGTAELRDYRVRIAAPHTDLIGYPTNFQKSFEGKKRNVYHPIHIRGLYQLYRYQDRKVFLDVAKRWTGYIADWKCHPLYMRFCDHDYTTNVPGRLRRYLTEESDARQG